MSVIFNRTVEALVLPPGGPLLLAAAGALLWRFGRRGGRWLVAAGLLALYALATPAVGTALLQTLESGLKPVDAAHLGRYHAGAIVVLGGGRYPGAPEYGGDTVSVDTLARLRYAAYLQRRSGLPVLASGGAPYAEAQPEAVLMRKVLERTFGVGPVWVEGHSRNTRENAIFSASILKTRGIGTILLVTDAWHMPRAAAVFRESGLSVVPAPTDFATGDAAEPVALRWLPNASALRHSELALHEWLGRLWYALQGG